MRKTLIHLLVATALVLPTSRSPTTCEQNLVAIAASSVRIVRVFVFVNG